MNFFASLPASHDVPWRALRHEVAGISPSAAATKVLKYFGVSRPAVDVVDIAKRLGVEVFLANNLGNVLGALDSTLPIPHVWINSSDHPKRQRFSIAHELGHLLRHPLGQMLRDESFAPSNKPNEADANEFASHLLMPLWLLEPLVGDRRQSTEELADAFNVSLPAMRWQLAKLI